MHRNVKECNSYSSMGIRTAIYYDCLYSFLFTSCYCVRVILLSTNIVIWKSLLMYLYMYGSVCMCMWAWGVCAWMHVWGIVCWQLCLYSQCWNVLYGIICMCCYSLKGNFDFYSNCTVPVCAICVCVLVYAYTYTLTYADPSPSPYLHSPTHSCGFQELTGLYRLIN